MNAEGLEKLIFTDVHFNMKVELEKDDEWERKKAKHGLPDGSEGLPNQTVLGRKGSDHIRTELPVKLVKLLSKEANRYSFRTLLSVDATNLFENWLLMWSVV